MDVYYIIFLEQDKYISMCKESFIVEIVYETKSQIAIIYLIDVT